MADEVILNKTQSIERCLKRIFEEFDSNRDNLIKNITKQDAILLNMERASQAAIDLCLHLIRIKKLQVPQESREGFVILAEAGIISTSLSQSLQKMVGFRNLAVHTYQNIDMNRVATIIEGGFLDLKEYVKICLKEL